MFAGSRRARQRGDIADRGYPRFDGCVDFLRGDQSRANNIVCDPPFHICDQFVRHALALIKHGKVAMIWLLRRLNAARWLADTPLARVYLLTPRPSLPPGGVILAGEKPKGGTQDFVWLVFDHKHEGASELRWLRRDEGDQPDSVRDSLAVTLFRVAAGIAQDRVGLGAPAELVVAVADATAIGLTDAAAVAALGLDQ